ncbi:hypothetical protein UFOVP35_63 [uncultured Caudovirales phage]|uniref:Uncharacterized protein n=1 Tax=uncultured Caudovirales phage TaxID=2100421 RepID=A0A6J7WP53_9CAUD|nr:hypothetical protein UFOVP35_63 [uncultured Caudovirales phage]CAB4124861.1 hypothetical protein UFOVP52_60 [uncultured Caudovirales phage]CAB5219801.1 hypothetical protein UFOVP234_8 [uncultured Caudovirales phage]
MFTKLFIVDQDGNLTSEFYFTEQGLDDAIDSWEMAGKETYIDGFMAYEAIQRNTKKGVNKA